MNDLTYMQMLAVLVSCVGSGVFGFIIGYLVAD